MTTLGTFSTKPNIPHPRSPGLDAMCTENFIEFAHNYNNTYGRFPPYTIIASKFNVNRRKVAKHLNRINYKQFRRDRNSHRP